MRIGAPGKNGLNRYKRTTDQTPPMQKNDCIGGKNFLAVIKKYVLLFSDESRIVLLSVIRIKNKLTQQGRYTDCVDELIAKFAII